MLKKNRTSQNLTNLLLQFNLKLEFNEPTRLSSKSCIDNFAHNFTNTSSKILELGLSDHTSQILKIPVKKTLILKHWKVKRRDYSKHNLEKFRECLSNLSFSEIFDCTCPNKAYNNFIEIFTTFYKLCFPSHFFYVSNNKKPKWISKGIKNCCKKKRQLLWAYRKNGNITNKNKLNEYSIKLKKIINFTQKAQNNNYINSSNNKSKATWKIINENNNLNYPNEPIAEIKEGNSVTNNPEKITNLFNNFFINQVKSSVNITQQKNACINDVCSQPKSIFIKPTSPSEILKIICGQKNKNSVGPDEVNIKVIKYAADILSVPLSHIINLCISKGIFPDKLKVANIIPIHKKGDKKNMRNYRPIALLSAFAKIFEKIIYDRFYDFFDKNKIFAKEQKGFQKNKTINTAIYDLLQPVLTSMDERNNICALFMDLTKAFDFVNHNILLNKLESHGIRGNSLDLIKSYLSNRKQSVILSGIDTKTATEKQYNSDVQDVFYGVPQGSVLGPLLFLIYINDLPLTINYPIILFADDTTVIFKCNKENYEAEINQTLSTIINWLNNNNLEINLDKTKIMHFSQRKATPNLKIEFNGHNVEKVSSTKFLGIHLDENMSWKTHSEVICKRISKSSYALHKLQKKASIDSVITAYHGLVASILRYGIIFWGYCSEKETIFKQQKRCIRSIFNLKRIDSCKPYFKKYNILPLPCMYIYEVAIFVKLNPKLFCNNNDKLSNRNLRNKHNLCIRPSNTTLLHNSLFCIAPKIYNKLPPNLSNLPLSQFKKKLFTLLVSKCYYSVKDYLEDKNL